MHPGTRRTGHPFVGALLFIFTQRLSYPMLDDQAGAGTLKKDVGHDVIVDLYESSILIPRNGAPEGEKARAVRYLPGQSHLRRWGAMAMPPQAWTRFLLGRNVPTDGPPLGGS
jgi:hypothetical protein